MAESNLAVEWLRKINAPHPAILLANWGDRFRIRILSFLTLNMDKFMEAARKHPELSLILLR
jgi:hypothetical protein